MKSTIESLAVILVSLPLALSTPEGLIADRITGSNVTSVPYPYVAFVMPVPYSGEHQEMWSCAGAILDPLNILTAAHCVFKAHRVRVVVGVSDLEECNAETRQVRLLSQAHVLVHEHFIVYERYGHLVMHNDLALLRLPSPLTLTEQVQPAPLLGEPPVLEEGFPVKFLGWGQTDPADANAFLSSKLKEAVLMTVANVTAVLPFLRHDDEPYRCAKNVGQGDVCPGDDGGPVVYGEQPFLAGLASYGHYECGSSEAVSCFVLLNPFSKWIEEHKKQKF